MLKYNVAVVLVNYNGFNDTLDCIKSILDSQSEIPFITLVDNNSNETEKLKEFCSSIKNIHLILNESNVGFGNANNLGIDWVLNNIQTDYIFLLNNDTIIQPNSIKILIDSFPKDDKTVLVTPKILTYENKSRIWYAGGSFNHSRMSVNINEYGQLNKEIKSCYTEFASGCAMLIKSNYLKSKLCFDPYFFMYEEDLELCVRLSRENKKIYFINESLIFHKCQGSQNTNSNKVINQLHPFYPNLEFYLNQTIPNRFYIVNKNFKNFYKIYYKASLSAYFISKSIQYFMFRNFKMSSLTIRLIFKNLFIK